jgi:predicted MFS family arabinose efflux permease
MLGLADAGNPLGAVLFLPLAQWLISTMGWQVTFRILGITFFLLVGPANLLLQRRPPLSRVVTDPGGAAVRHTPPPALPSSPSAVAPMSPGGRAPVAVEPTLWHQIVRQPPVWGLVLARLCATLGTHLTSVHLVAFFVATGYDPVLAAAAIAGVGGISIVGRPLSGALSDVLGREVMYTVGLGMHISAIMLVLTVGDGQRWWPLLLFVGLAGLSDGIGGLVVGAKAGDLFPATSLGVVMGLVQMGRGLGIMAGPILGGLLFDLQGNYRVAFLFAVALVTVAIGCMWGVRWSAGQAGHASVTVQHTPSAG